ncbi:hypothetical protein SAMN05421647_11348 [Marinobacterium stanieri]|uniref:Uncharacterized protein n=1 Tax=Marinobacterium stanieri TaxID=49186 RepID=A0A1N6XAF5_9GAMM|nr:hypothetical protein SAMN05421647_11348 [Marinobacterium stanieri]
MIEDQNEKVYRLFDLRVELIKLADKPGIMSAYELVAKELGCSTSEVRRWFTSEDNSSFRAPPREKAIWDYLECVSGYRLDRNLYHPKPDFWD